MGQETRYFDGYGPKLQIETGNPDMGVPGRAAFSLMSTTDSDVKFVLAHNENGLTKYYSEGVVQFEAGVHPTVNSNAEPTFAFISHAGDFTVNADKGSVRISGKQIVLDASREIVLQSARIRLGYEDGDKTKDIKLLAQNVDIKTKKGPLADALQTSSFIKSFDGTLIKDLAQAASDSPVSVALSSIGVG